MKKTKGILATILFTASIAILPGLLYAGNVSVILPTGSAFEVITGTQNTIMHVGSDGNIEINGDIKTDRWLLSDTNTFIGVNAAGLGNLDNTAGSEGYFNTAVGNSSLRSITTGRSNTALGVDALQSTTTTDYNTAVGVRSLNSNIGFENTALGMMSLEYNTSGDQNTSLGSMTLRFNTTGANNIAIGNKAGYGVFDSSIISNNVLLGIRAGLSLLTGGNNNILIGYQAGDNITTGAGNIILGYDLDAPSVDGDNQMYLGGVIYGDLATGNVGIGTTAPSAKFEVACPSGFTNIKAANNQLGCMQATEQSNNTWENSSNDCFVTYGGRLPTTGEWFIAMNNYVLADETDAPEWNDDAYSPNQHATSGLGSITAQSTGADTSSYDYRCWIPR